MANIQKYKLADLPKMCAHYERWQGRDVPMEKRHIDAERTALNYNLAADVQPLAQEEFVARRIDALALKRAPRKDAVRMCDCCLTLPQSFPRERQAEFFAAAYSFLAQTFGEENVASAWVHLDETTPHMHFAWVPVTEDGRLSAKDVVSKRVLQRLHPDLQDALETDLGCAVEILLDEEKKGKKALSKLPQPEYIAACEELERVEDERDRAREQLAAARRETEEETRRLERVRCQLADMESFAAQEKATLDGMPSAGEVESQRRELERAEREARAQQRALEGGNRKLEGDYRSLRAVEKDVRRAAQQAVVAAGDEEAAIYFEPKSMVSRLKELAADAVGKAHAVAELLRRPRHWLGEYQRDALRRAGMLDDEPSRQPTRNATENRLERAVAASRAYQGQPSPSRTRRAR